MSVVHEFIHEIVVTALLGVAGSVAMYPIKKISNAYTEVKDSLEKLHTELTTQRTNCLATLQEQGEEQITALKEIVSALRDMHIDQKIVLDRLER